MAAVVRLLRSDVEADHMTRILSLLAAAVLSVVTSGPALAYGGYTVTNYDSGILLGRKDLDRFYSERLPKGVYTAPGFSWINELGGTVTGCGNLDADQGMDEGAFYCSADNVVYLDYSLMSDVNDNFGYEGILTIMAHEWGHHAQNLLHRSFSSEMAQELNADCLSGAAMRWLSRSLTKIDVFGLEMQAYWSGDEPGYPPSHGTGSQRQSAWMRGWNAQSLQACR
jgi:predicted metalloprotease